MFIKVHKGYEVRYELNEDGFVEFLKMKKIDTTSKEDFAEKLVEEVN